MKKIGIIDYYISEWHANNYPGWMRAICTEKGLDYEISYAWAEKDISPIDGVDTDTLCKITGVEKCRSIAELCEKSDCILILAPSDPDKHILYASTALSYGKPTFIDKTFAPNLREAEEMFRIAKAHGTPLFSSSALRYASELETLGEPLSLIVTGGGSNFPEYAVHQIEIAVKVMKGPFKEFSVVCQGSQQICRMATEDGRCVSLVYASSLPFTVCAQTGGGESVYHEIQSDYFQVLMADILRFFETGIPSFDASETLEVMRTREYLIESGKWAEKVGQHENLGDRILGYCLEHYRETFSIEQIAEALDVRSYIVTRTFSERFHCSFRSYINNLRIANAADQLAKSDTPIMEIASSVGFSTLRTFNRVFLTEKGLTPSEFRKTYGKPKKSAKK